MPGYIQRLLSKLNHQASTAPQYPPHEYINVKWTNKGDRQYTQHEDGSNALSIPETKWIQSAI